MYDARFTGQVIARSDSIEVVEGNHHFLMQGVNVGHLRPSDKNSFCPWKGAANYNFVEIDGLTADNAAWTYGDPSGAARQNTDPIAFWHDVVLGPAASTHS